MSDPKLSSQKNPLLAIPRERLSEKVLNGIIESFILREGTDYGDGIFTLEEKVEQVKKEIKSNSLEILYDFKDDSFDIRKKENGLR